MKIILIFISLLSLQGCSYLFSDRASDKRISDKSQIHLKLPLGWEINKDAPSLLEIKKNGEILKKWDRTQLRSEILEVPQSDENELQLNGKIFYCEKEKPEICKMKIISDKLYYDKKNHIPSFEIKF